MPRPSALDEIKRHEICALLACGASRRQAAEYVGCATTSIANTARRDPDFAERLRQAECDYALRNLRAINRAASRSWRAAVWALREHDPEEFGHNRVSHVLPASIARAAAKDAAVGVPASADPLPTAPPAAEPPPADGPSAADPFLALEQAVAAAGLSVDQQGQVLARFALLTDPGLTAQFPGFFAQLGLLHDGSVVGHQPPPVAAVVGQKPPSADAVVGHQPPVGRSTLDVQRAMFPPGSEQPATQPIASTSERAESAAADRLTAAQSGPSLRDGNPNGPPAHNRHQPPVVGQKPPTRSPHNPPSAAAGRRPRPAGIGRFSAPRLAGFLLIAFLLGILHGHLSPRVEIGRQPPSAATVRDPQSHVPPPPAAPSEISLFTVTRPATLRLPRPESARFPRPTQDGDFPMHTPRLNTAAGTLAVLFANVVAPALAADPADTAAVEISSRRELFVDQALVERLDGGAEFRLHHPTPREVALTFEKPWEGNASGYATVFQDGDVYRMVYRGHRYIIDPPPLRQAQSEVVCYAESRDGIHWVKPDLGLFDWPPTMNNTGDKQNNIIWRGGAETHNFAPFKDTNPACRPEERYKAIGGTTTSNGLLTFKSADGIHWSPLSDGPVVTQGAFDSHNTVFWDADRQRYCMYVRYFSEAEFKGLRSIGMSHSIDFQTWSAPVGLTYPDSPPQQMYTNQIAPYYRSPHLLLGFPTRFVARPLSDHARRLEPIETRAQFIASIEGSGSYTGAEITDGLLMASRDGLAFRRWDEAFLRPGPQAAGRWIYGDNYQSYGLFETKADDPALPNEISMHFNEGSWRDDMHRVRRYTIRLDGFVSLHAGLAGGELTTKPLTFNGRRLSLNYATSAAGSLRVEIQDAAGSPIPGFALADADELFGDSVDQTAAWNGAADVSRLAGQPVRLRFKLQDGDVFAYQFTD